MRTLVEAQDLIARPKSLVADMVWSSKRGKVDFPWITCRIAVQFDDEPFVREQFFVECQWRKKGNRIPEYWTFNLLCQSDRIYALHVQPTSKHVNHVGKGLLYYRQDVGGIHQHIWVEEGDGYAEPINVPLDQPEVMWRMFLSRANIHQVEFFHPDENQPELEL